MSVNKRSKFKAGVIVFLGFCPVEAVISRQFQRDISLMPSVIYACPGQIGKLAVLSIILYSRSITFCRTKCITSERFRDTGQKSGKGKRSRVPIRPGRAYMTGGHKAAIVIEALL